MADTYYLPQPHVFQEFLLTVAPPSRRLHAFIFGPHAQLLRYSVEDEKDQILVGTYDHVGESIDGEYKTCYEWPARADGAAVDQDSVQVYIDKALLRIYNNEANEFEKKSANKIRHPSFNFAANGASYPRNAALKRDIRPGDLVAVRAETADKTLFTYVKSVLGDTVAATLSAVTPGDNNTPDQSLAASVSVGGSNTNDIAATASGSAYDGRISGDMTETYTITVTQASTGGDATTARLRVTSASGRDDVASVTPAAFASATDIGSRGLTVTFSDSGDDNDFALGDTYTATVTQAWDTRVLTITGTYTGTTTRTYIVEVVKGGDWTDGPQITVTATDGSDFSGPTTILDPEAVPLATVSPDDPYTVATGLGSYGVSGRFSDGGLRYGDRWTFTATPAKEGNKRTLVLAHNLSEDIAVDDDEENISVAIYIGKNIEVAKKHLENEGDYTYETSDTEICLLADLYATDSSWVDSNGDPIPLPVISDDLAVGHNKVYVQYRAWLPTYVDTVSMLDDVGDIDEIPGPLVEENTLKWGVYKALLNNNGQPVRFSGVADPTDLEAWTSVLDLIEERRDVYGLVPLTYDQDVLDATKAHIDSMSNEFYAAWRGGWYGLEGVTSKTLISANLSSDGEVVLATTEDDPGTSGTQYTLLRVTSGNADLEALGIKAGDKVRYKYTTNAWGDVTYTTFTVDEVLTAETARLVSGTTAEEATPIKVEFFRNLTKTEQATEISNNARVWDSRRIKAVWFDNVTGGQPTTPNYFVCAALAALTGGVAPQQGVTHISLNGFAGLSGRASYFSRTQMNAMAGNGVWIVVEHTDGTIFNRHAVTTAAYNEPKFREEMYVRNSDSVSYYFWDLLYPYVGKYNVTDDVIAQIETDIKAGGNYLKTNGATPLLGGQLNEATLLRIGRHPTFPDRIEAFLRCDGPFPLNNPDLHLIF